MYSKQAASPFQSDRIRYGGAQRRVARILMGSESCEYEMAERLLPGAGGGKAGSIPSEFWGLLTAGSQRFGLTE